MLKHSVEKIKENLEIFNLRGKFNSILEERLLDGNADNHHIMSIVVSPEHFDFSGTLTDAGKAGFWLEVDKAMHHFDIGEIKLQPRKVQSQTMQQNAMQGSNFLQTAVSQHNAQNLRKRQNGYNRLPTPPRNTVDHHHKEKYRNSSRRTRTRSDSRSRKPNKRR